jgi:hypothetical protein
MHDIVTIDECYARALADVRAVKWSTGFRAASAYSSTCTVTVMSSRALAVNDVWPAADKFSMPTSRISTGTWCSVQFSPVSVDVCSTSVDSVHSFVLCTAWASAFSLPVPFMILLK